MGQFEVLRRPGDGVRKAASPRVLPATLGVQGMERLGLWSSVFTTSLQGSEDCWPQLGILTRSELGINAFPPFKSVIYKVKKTKMTTRPKKTKKKKKNAVVPYTKTLSSPHRNPPTRGGYSPTWTAVYWINSFECFEDEFMNCNFTLRSNMLRKRAVRGFVYELRKFTLSNIIRRTDWIQQCLVRHPRRHP